MPTAIKEPDLCTYLGYTSDTMDFKRQFVSGTLLKVTEKSLFTGSHKKYIRLDFNENV